MVIKAIPKLRFKKFHGYWVSNKLKLLGDIQAGGDIDRNKLSKHSKYPVLSNGSGGSQIDGYYPDYKIKAPAITVTGRGTLGIARAQFKSFTPVIRLISIKSNILDTVFGANAINQIHIFKEYTGVPQLTAKQLKEYYIKFPSLSEQRQIGKFFATLDQLIHLQQKRITLLKKLKKAYLQKLFPRKNETIPRIRFEGFRNKWNKTIVNNVAAYKNGHSLEKQVIKNGSKIVIDLNSISINGNLKDSGKRLPNNFSDTLNKNDLVMILSDLAHGNLIGLTAVIPKDNKYVLNQRVGLLKFKNNINSIFMHYLLNSIQRYFHRMSAGTSQLNLSKKDILRTKILIPTLNEQICVAKLLDNVDLIISSHRNLLNEYKLIKKAYLQKMFC